MTASWRRDIASSEAVCPRASARSGHVGQRDRCTVGGALHLPKEQIAMLINADPFAGGIAALIHVDCDRVAERLHQRDHSSADRTRLSRGSARCGAHLARSSRDPSEVIALWDFDCGDQLYQQARHDRVRDCHTKE